MEDESGDDDAKLLKSLRAWNYQQPREFSKRLLQRCCAEFTSFRLLFSSPPNALS
jgi:hypothetical protein